MPFKNKAPHELHCTKVKRLLYNRAKDIFKKHKYDLPPKEVMITYFGESIEQIVYHLESKFQYGMSWDNHGCAFFGNYNAWHIDHILPLSSAKNQTELITLFYYTNLQPLWAKNNLMKGSKIVL